VTAHLQILHNITITVMYKYIIFFSIIYNIIFTLKNEIICMYVI